MIFERYRNPLEYRFREADDHSHRVAVALSVAFNAKILPLDICAIVVPDPLDRAQAEWGYLKIY